MVYWSRKLASWKVRGRVLVSGYENRKQEQEPVWKVLNKKTAARYLKEETVKVPVHYVKIGSDAFKSSIKMEKLLLPNGMRELGSDAFRHSKALREAALPHSILRIGSGCFADCPSLRTAYISNSLESISEDLFKEDRRLEKVLFTKENRTERIQKNAFCECTSLERILLPPRLTEIDDRAFYRCKALKQVRFPEGLKRIGKDAFYFCGLESLELPESLEILDEKAFFKCTQLTEVRLPTHIRRIEKWVFHGCSRLKLLEIRHDPEYIGEWIINRAARIRCYQGSKVDAYCRESGFTVEYLE